MCQNKSAGVVERRAIQRPLRAGRSYTAQIGGVSGAAGLLDFAFEWFPDRDGDEVFDEAPDKCADLRGIPAFGGCPPVVRGSPRLTVIRAGASATGIAIAIAILGRELGTASPHAIVSRLRARLAEPAQARAS